MKLLNSMNATLAVAVLAVSSAAFAATMLLVYAGYGWADTLAATAAKAAPNAACAHFGNLCVMQQHAVSKHFYLGTRRDSPSPL